MNADEDTPARPLPTPDARANVADGSDRDRVVETLINAAGALVLVLDASGRFIRFNRACERISGWTAREVLGRTPWQTVLPPDVAQPVRRQAFEAAMARLQPGDVTTHANEWLARDGTRRFIEWTDSVMLRSDGSRCMVTVGVDATERRSQEQALRRITRQLEQAQAMAGIGSWEVDLASDEVAWSAQARCILETEPGRDPPGEAGFLARLHPDDRAAFVEAKRHAAASGTTPSLELRLLMSDGRVKWLALCLAIEHDEAGRAARCTVSIQDITERRGREADLLRFKHMVEHATQEVWLTDADKRVRYVNAAGAASVGRTPEQLLGHSLDELDAGGAQFVDAAMRAAKAQQDSRTGVKPFETLHRHRDGHAVPKEIHPTLALIGDEWLHLCFAVDISERQRLLQTLAASESALNAMLDVFPGWVVCFDDAYRYRYVNEAYCHFAGRPQREVIARTVEEVRGQDVAAALRSITGQLSPGRIVTDERRHLDAAGRETIYWVQFLAAPDATRPGRHLIYGFGTDITDSRRTTWRLDTVVENMRVGVWEWHAASGTITVNAELPGLIGLGREGRSNQPADWIRDFVHPDDQPARRRQIKRVMAGEIASFECEFRARHKDGHWIWLQERGRVASTSASGQPLTLIGATQDITALKRQEQALQQLNTELEARVEQRTRELQEARAQAEMASAAKSEFLSLMSHELRTPLNAIIGFGQLLQLSGLPSEQAQHVREVMHAGRHLTNLIDEVLDLATVEAGRMRLVTEAFDVHATIGECIAMLSSAARDAEVRIEQVATTAHAHVAADRGRLKQVLLNLLSNAIKYNRPGGRVTVECRVDGERQLQVSVTDSGWGMTAEQLDRLFQPFERLAATRSAVQGTGIGLALSKRLVELMGGAIGVESEPGRGSTFWLQLPVVKAAATQPPRQAPDAPVLSPGAGRPDGMRSIVYVEDNLPNQRLMQRILGMRGGLLLTCSADPRAALARIQREPPALVLLDLQLPDLDGYQVLAAIRAAGMRVPVVAVTAHAMPVDQARGVRAGFDDYLTKPLDVTQVLDTIDRLLGATGQSAA